MLINVRVRGESPSRPASSITCGNGESVMSATPKRSRRSRRISTIWTSPSSEMGVGRCLTEIEVLEQINLTPPNVRRGDHSRKRTTFFTSHHAAHAGNGPKAGVRLVTPTTVNTESPRRAAFSGASKSRKVHDPRRRGSTSIEKKSPLVCRCVFAPFFLPRSASPQPCHASYHSQSAWQANSANFFRQHMNNRRSIAQAH
jgi:hypothetical protein